MGEVCHPSLTADPPRGGRTSIVRKGLAVSGGQVLCVLLNLLVTILFSRTLGPRGMGQFELFRSAQMIGVTIAVLGMSNTTVYFLNNLKVAPERVVTTAFKASLALGVCLAVGMIAATVGWPRYFGHVSLAIAAWFAVGSACLCSMYILRGTLIAEMAARSMVVVALAPPVTTLVVGGLLALLGRLSLEPVLAVFSLGNVASALVTMLYQRQYISLARPFEWKLFGSLLGYGLKLGAANLLLVLSSSVTVMLLRYLRPDDLAAVGLYGRAVGISGMVTLVPGAIGALLYAVWAGTRGEARARQGERAIRTNLAFGVTACAVLLLAGKLVIRLLYGERFIGANQALQLLAPSLVFLTVFNVCSNMLAGDGKAMTSVCILAGTACITIAVSWAAIPTLGMRGAALAVLCSNAFTALVSVVACARYYGLRPFRCLVLGKDDLQYMGRALWRPSAAATRPPVPSAPC